MSRFARIGRRSRVAGARLAGSARLAAAIVVLCGGVGATAHAVAESPVAQVTAQAASARWQTRLDLYLEARF